MSALITDEQHFLLPANGRESLQNPDFDPAPVVKLFVHAGRRRDLVADRDRPGRS